MASLPIAARSAARAAAARMQPARAPPRRRKGCQPTAPDRVPGCGGGRGRPLLPARGRTVAGGVLYVVTAIFIILDLNEKTGWTERNTKREFFGHIDVFFGSEKSIKKAVKSVRNRIPDAKRIGVKIDYEIITLLDPSKLNQRRSYRHLL